MFKVGPMQSYPTKADALVPVISRSNAVNMFCCCCSDGTGVLGVVAGDCIPSFCLERVDEAAFCVMALVCVM